jgi:peptidoglycan hydrolase-like protein with peptidoglycan-binding domain
MLIVRKARSAPRSLTDGTTIYEGTALTFTDTGLTNRTTYYYGFFPVLLSGTATTPARTVSATPTAGVSQTSTLRTVATTTTTSTTTNTSSGGSSGPNITRTLLVGMRGTDVTALQDHLISLNYLTGVSTGYFGTLTEGAVKKYQCAKAITCTGTPSTTGYGAVGPRTRIALKGTTTTATPTPTTSTTLPVLTRDLSLGARGTDVTALQNYLISKNYLTVGNNTGYFGPLTQAAVIKFQIANNITPALGYFGAKSRGVLK